MHADIDAMQRLDRHWDAQGIPADRRLLSVYTSALDVAAGTKSPAAVGSLIHALGEKNRTDFTALVAERKVAAVTTIAPDYSGWEGWNLRANWPFFEALRRNYTPVARNDQHVLWVVDPPNAATPSAQCSIARTPKASLQVNVTASSAGLASVSIERQRFDAQGRGAMMTVIEDSPFTRAATGSAWGDFPRYGIANTHHVQVAAPVEPGTITRLTFETLGHKDMGEASCTARVYPPIDFASLPTLRAGIAAHIARASQ